MHRSLFVNRKVKQMTEKKISVSQWITLSLSAAVVLAVKLLPPPMGLTAAGFQILGILAVALMLFLSWGTGWPSMFIVAVMMTVPGLSAADVTKATFGNNTVVFLLLCFMLAACLVNSGVARRIAIWFLTNKLARKSPWLTVLMYFSAVYVLGLVLSAAVCIMILLPILLSIFESVELDRQSDKQLASMLLLGTVAVAQLANGANPISHAVTTQGFALYEAYTGEAMDFFHFCAVATPVSLAGTAALYLLLRYVWRPDVGALSAIDYDALAASCSPMSKREKWSVFFYAACVLLWLLPGLSTYLMPSAAPFLGRINNCIPPLIALFFMNFIRVDGEQILSWEEAVKAINWPTFMFIAAIMGFGSFMGNSNIGLPQWMSSVMSPLLGNVKPLVFLLLMVIIVNVLTNFCSNSVALSVVFAVAMPLCMTVYDGLLDPMLVAIFITSSSQNGWATAPATPTAAVAYASGWANQRVVLRWGLIIMLIQTIICFALGIPLAGALR